MSFSASVTGHMPGESSKTTAELKAALEELATSIKDAGGLGQIWLSTDDFTGTLQFRPGDSLSWG